MRWFNKGRIALAAFMLSAQFSTASASEVGCVVQNNLSSLVLDSKNFLDYLETGMVAETLWFLDKRLKTHATTDLPAQLKQMDLARYAALTDLLITQQQGLVQAYKQSGRSSASQNATAIQARKHLNSVRSVLARVPCTSAASKSAVGGVTGGGLSSMAASVAKSGAFRLIAAMFLIGAVVIAAFGWFSQIGKRRTKRYSCLLPCTVVSGGNIHPAMITNISRTGAKLNTDKGFEKGNQVQVSFIGETADSRVIRHKNGQLAVDFNTMLHLEVLERVLGGVTADTLTKPSLTPATEG